MVIGTVDLSAWKRVSQDHLPTEDTIEALHDFKEVVAVKPVGGWGWGK